MNRGGDERPFTLATSVANAKQQAEKLHWPWICWLETSSLHTATNGAAAMGLPPLVLLGKILQSLNLSFSSVLRAPGRMVGLYENEKKRIIHLSQNPTGTGPD